MKLIKVKDGLLEVENFFLTSSFSDFAGSANVTRDMSTGKMKLISNNKIERNFTYTEFVVELEKENFNDVGIDDHCSLYFGNDKYAFGIREMKQGEQHKFWKILKEDNYVQAYASDDGINYTNIGGMNFIDAVLHQGFEKYSNEDFILDNYKVYASPYVTIQNFPENTVCELYDSNNNLLKTRTFNGDLECKIFLDSNIQGYFIFKDSTGNQIYKSDLLDLKYGDVYVFSKYELEVIYNGLVVTNTSPVVLKDLQESITIKNIDTKDYAGLKIEIQTASDDLIQLSLDGSAYSDSVSLDLLQGQSKDVFVKITKNVDNHNFSVRDFQLVIDE
ncbi:hypothetical protein [Clostridium coskatii]|uniref:Uncharacterized protein n=1 Tax=Clostridium coskatii TaxID=1705578 RepID=A0A166SZA5_9CLOT|nr:hypothetical protein [Clostridium coskatii]OAA92993.1 hypothetical protein WX73_00311 [Clostridium coskatii]OBR90465.1 hypothetical protein CLCOS_40230 [Clostridium coskatii]